MLLQNEKLRKQVCSTMNKITVRGRIVVSDVAMFVIDEFVERSCTFGIDLLSIRWVNLLHFQL